MRRLWWILLLSLALPWPVGAQVSTATLEVQVVDLEGLAVPGATVEVTAKATGVVRRAVTDAQGLAQVASLAPGSYDLRVEIAGFAPVLQEDVNLLVGQRARVKVTLQPQVQEEVTVTAQVPLVDVYKADTSTNIVPEQIEQLPVPDRDFQRLAFLVPGVQRERGEFRFITGAPVLGAGGNASGATILVDGVDLTDQALGLARARFSQDAIREFRVITNRFDAEIGGSAGGAMSIITKSGTNDLAGSVFGFYRADQLRARGRLEQGTQDFSRYQTGFTLGGPVVRDKTHYFASLEYINEDNIVLFRPQGAFRNQAKDISHPFNQTLLLASLSHALRENQLLNLKLVGERYRENNFRVGGVADESSGMDLNRDNWNFTTGHSWVISDKKLNNLYLQVGRKQFDEPNNSQNMAEYFSLGTTLITGANIVGDQKMTGDYLELRDTFQLYLTSDRWGSHDLKAGFSFQRIEEDWHYPLFPKGLMFWLTDSRTVPFRYDYGVGDPNLAISTNLYGLFLQDTWRLNPRLSVTLGLRYDYDTDGNNPDFTHPLYPQKRKTDKDNYQPRLAFVWDTSGDGRTVIRGGAGRFTGRYLLIPAFIEQQQNGVTGYTLYTRLNGALYGLPQFTLNPANPRNTGLLLPPNIALLEPSLEAPESDQVSLGFTQRLGTSGLFLDVEAIWVEGDKEIIVRDVNFKGNQTGGRRYSQYTQINMYTNDGRSKYKAITMALSGTLQGGHLLSGSLTWGHKKNIADDFSPALLEYPSDPANIAAEWGRARSDERWRLVVSAIFKLPWGLTAAPMYEYGSGQPWNRRLGYDYNGDGRFSDRASWIKRNSEDGPIYRNFNLRITKTFALGGVNLDLIAEGFNLFNNVNYNVNSVDSAEYLSGPTLSNPNQPFVRNPNFGKYSATLPPREIQLGLRVSF
ncbi:MAG: TonB-dependent receptor [Thermoanaerobaculum sp.]|nr:TonB-dependent receptor [Thermoanaerobaculum sp.]